MEDIIEFRKTKLKNEAIKNPMRQKILKKLKNNRLTILQLSQRLKINVDTVRHQVTILERVGAVSMIGERVKYEL